MKSKTKISKQTQRKNNSELVETIFLAKKNKEWINVASELSKPRRLIKNMNLEEIDKQTKEGESVIIPGKVLSKGDLNKKIKVIALSYSENARQKLLNNKNEINYIIDEIKKNPNASGLRLLK